MAGDYLQALMTVDAFWDRMPGVVFVAWGKTAKEMRDNLPLTEPITFVMRPEELTSERKDIFRDFFEGSFQGLRGFVGKIDGVHVNIRLSTSNYINNPDVVNYSNEYYKIPNPINDYIDKYVDRKPKKKFVKGKSFQRWLE